MRCCGTFFCTSTHTSCDVRNNLGDNLFVLEIKQTRNLNFSAKPWANRADCTFEVVLPIHCQWICIRNLFQKNNNVQLTSNYTVSDMSIIILGLWNVITNGLLQTPLSFFQRWSRRCTIVYSGLCVFARLEDNLVLEAPGNPQPWPYVYISYTCISQYMYVCMDRYT